MCVRAACEAREGVSSYASPMGVVQSVQQRDARTQLKRVVCAKGMAVGRGAKKKGAPSQLKKEACASPMGGGGSAKAQTAPSSPRQGGSAFLTEVIPICHPSVTLPPLVRQPPDLIPYS